MNIIEGNYNIWIVMLSFVIAILASYSALSIAAKISQSSGRTQWVWLCSGAVVMGNGIWSMHFVGMLAFHLHAGVSYDIGLTLLSMGASVLASFIAFIITMPKETKGIHLVVGGFMMAIGIVSMHYIGMEAMIMKMEITYDPFLWALSALIAFVAAYAALFLFLKFRSHTSSSLLKWLSAVVMGIAICGMHYTGMEAAIFQGDIHEVMEHEDTQMNGFLLLGVSVTIFIMLFVSWMAMFVDRHVLEKMAYRDTITGLPNRNEMNRFFDHDNGKENRSVLFLDLDQFKAINDTLGHHVGDRLVQEVGHRLQQFVGANREVFRIGGDEFLIIEKGGSLEQAEMLAAQLLQEIKKVYRIEGHEMYVTGSIGISIGCIQEADRSILLKTADTAMYKAKSLGKNQYCVYTEEMGMHEVRKMELEKDMQRALEHSEFYMEYQPKWNVKTNQLYGFEALIRWRHPRLGIVPPKEFIPIAEETGLIIPITRWTLEQACRECKLWQSRGVAQPVSVNVSTRMFQTDTLVEYLKDVLEQTGLLPEYLELEITESMVIYDIEDIVRQLNIVRRLGVRVSMDDFGTGYSSIGLLDRIPIDALKLDRLFTQDLETPSKRAIVHAIVLMAENLKLDVIAEGVENQEHIAFLTELGCHVMQGYYYGRPMANDRITDWMQEFARSGRKNQSD